VDTFLDRRARVENEEVRNELESLLVTHDTRAHAGTRVFIEEEE
jgi:hypothetical protein